MPKGKQYFNWETSSLSGRKWVARNTPFHTSYYSDATRIEVVDGKTAPVADSDDDKTFTNRLDSPSRKATSPARTSNSRANHCPSDSPNTVRLPAIEMNRFSHVPQRTSSLTNGQRKNEGVAYGQSPQEDDGNDFQNSVTTSRDTGRHKILPPISSDNTYSQKSVLPASNQPNDSDQTGKDLASYASEIPSKSEELEALARRIRAELTNFSANILKYIYLKLTELDTQLIGYVTFSELERVFQQSKIDLNPNTLRTLASMFPSVHRSNVINYEGLLSFIAKTVRMHPATEERELTGMGALRRLIEKQLQAGGCSLEYEQIWNFFQQADRSRRDRLSRDQIKRLVAACRLPLSEFVVDQVLNRCNIVSDRYSWQEFLGYIEHVYPMKTSLTIPPTLRRIREAPDVSSDWLEEEAMPRVRISALPLEEELVNLGTMVEETRRKLREEKREGFLIFKPWFERFMHMAKAIYSFDQSKTGQVSVLITRWIIHECNKAYNLELDEDRVELVMKSYTEADKVLIEPFLKTLVAHAP